MTRDTFLEALRGCAGQYWWYIAAGNLRATEKPTRRGLFCPRTAVQYARHEERYHTSHWEEVATRLGLPLEDATAIVCAADNDMAREDTAYHALREALLQAIGLMPEEQA